MNPKITKEVNYHNRIISTFIGQKIEAIFYEEINYEENKEYWEFSKIIHSIDMNVIMKFSNGKLIQLFWDNEFESYGIGFIEIFELETKEGYKLIQVSDNINWKNIIGKTISAIKVYWDESESQSLQKVFNYLIPIGRKTHIRLPLTWEINFEGENLWISTLELRENGNPYYWADHLTIMFSEDDANKYSLKNPQNNK